jgi:tetratricopeptide (TPR) repeat protein
MSRRLEMLEKMTASGQGDAFAWYALALEYKSAGRPNDALRTFETLRETDPGYLPMYLMAGQLLVDLEQPDEARPWLEQGIGLAREKRDGKSLGELEAALAACE